MGGCVDKGLYIVDTWITSLTIEFLGGGREDHKIVLKFLLVCDMESCLDNFFSQRGYIIN